MLKINRLPRGLQNALGLLPGGVTPLGLEEAIRASVNVDELYLVDRRQQETWNIGAAIIAATGFNVAFGTGTLGAPNVVPPSELWLVYEMTVWTTAQLIAPDALYWAPGYDRGSFGSAAFALSNVQAFGAAGAQPFATSGLLQRPLLLTPNSHFGAYVGYVTTASGGLNGRVTLDYLKISM